MEERKHEWFTQISELGIFRCLKCNVLRTPESEKTPCIIPSEDFKNIFGGIFGNSIF